MLWKIHFRKNLVMGILEKLFEMRDEKYAKFQANLIPTIDPKLFIGVRVPNARKLAKEIVKEGGYEQFLNDLPHKYYDENMLHGLIVSENKDWNECMKQVEEFLPYVDNWAVCDIMSPKIFRKNKEKLLPLIEKWSASKDEYTCRFGIEMLMSYFLDEDFKKEYLEIPAKIKSDKYYINMMIAWFFATALAKQWDDTIVYIVEKRLEKWVHNKTIQKAVESRRITDAQKEYLRSCKLQ